MTCLVCRYFQPAEPPEHKQAREARQCEAHCGNKWNQHTAIQYVKHHGTLGGWCRLHPEPKHFNHNHICGQISLPDYFFNHHWCVEPLTERDNLFEWAEKTLATVLHGPNRWDRTNELREDNAELRRQLKRAREISASRLKRLQKTDKSKPEPEPEPEPLAEPFRPHLVAAE